MNQAEASDESPWSESRTRLRRTFWRVLSGCSLLAVMTFTVRAQTLTFTTFAGPAGGPGSADGTGSSARFFSPDGVAIDSGGNVYVADTSNHAIRKVSPAGVVTTVAGLAGVFGNADGIGGAARFDYPKGVATDRDGNMYVADTHNATIRKITQAGVVTTLAGAPGIAGSADGTGSAARFSGPTSVATDSNGNVYVADARNYTIRKITPAGAVTTLAGSAGLGGNADGTGSDARFASLTGVATDSAGNVYAVDADNYTVRKITPAGVVATLADGTGGAIRFDGPVGVATDSGGNIYVTDSGAVRKITPAGVMTTLAGPGGIYVASADGNAARFFSGVAPDSGGNIYVADSSNHLIRKITAAGVVTTLAGLDGPRGSADGTGSAARFSSPEGVATDSDGNVYVADTETASIRKITPAGVVTTLAGSGPGFDTADGAGSAAHFSSPSSVATDRGGNVYVLDGPTDSHTIRKITPEGVVTTLADLPGVVGIAGSGGNVCVYTIEEDKHTIQTTSPPRVDSAGNVYASAYTIDEDKYTIRRISPAEGDSGGDVYVADTNNDMIRKITPAGVVTAHAGSGQRGSADGAGSDARFNMPLGVAADSGGNVYVADTYNQTIRKITPAGLVTTVGGSPGLREPGLRGSADGTGSAARFFRPSGVATDGNGNVYVADTYNHKIRVGRPALADAATIDSSTGPVGTPRQLSTSSQTATSWQWHVIRQPSGSKATLSSTSVRNPRFTPDVADLYIFQLTASKGEKTSITTVSLTATTSASSSAARSVP